MGVVGKLGQSTYKRPELNKGSPAWRSWGKHSPDAQ